MVETAVRARIRVSGIVQGVGFRPFVHGLAEELGLAGFVGNDELGVIIEAEGSGAALAALLVALRERPPPLALVSAVAATDIPAVGDTAFAIAASSAGGRRVALVPADTATCADCLAELRDPADRRYRHPFITCTNCGPRFTIITDVPYDRAATTMAAFPMCAACAAEYHDPRDRRFHAQPVSCHECGPRLRCSVPGDDPGDDPVAAAAGALRAGAVLAVKGIGGFHLAALAGDETAVAALRARKHREDKPFAVLAPSVSAAGELGEVGPVEAAELVSRRAPIVLLRRRNRARLAAAVAPGNRHVGVLLPYTPIHHMLLDEVREPIVLTSGNVSDEPIVHRDGDLGRLAGIADAVLTHDRPIRTRADDSVVRIVRGAPYLARRSRGFAPEPVELAVAADRTVLGCGAELKNTFCLLRGSTAVPSHHIGDLENVETLRAFTDGIAHLSRLLDVTPEVVAHDLHPEYLSTKWAHDQEGVELVGVQHHHAHLASCLAEHGVAGPVIGIACDGLGYGTDGALWGCEVMDVSLAAFTRLVHLEPVALPGGTTAIRQPWRMAVAWLRAAGVSLPAFDARLGTRTDPVRRLLDSDVPVPSTTSAGRLFDAVAALVGVRDAVTYEGQAAIELEQLADPSVPSGYPTAGLCGADLIRGVVADLRTDVPAAVVAARFHNGLAAALVTSATGAARSHGRDTVALSGGVFQNLLLLERVRTGLEATGLRVLVHSRMPCNDGGISLGQVAVAASR
ncbi:carbamoyltransferase HypF [Pseudonocardia sp. TRM90224]|uniref:carbamoyltransferase HypF n=1 Tax=Pseudonocardia sp. TRM90224 TaxID=2812678 RepID=UPI001E3C10C7|nr:carbamoyltransferase HypF [Pseudonocardia sp. TRM90224]